MTETADHSDKPKPDEPNVTETSGISSSGEHILNRIIKRFGGRHLIFRTQLGKWSLIPRPYGLVSTFRGPVWFFYGIGQVWVTHKKYRAFDGWLARVPRIWAPKIVQLLDSLDAQLTQFTHHCNEKGIEGTIILDPHTIEFHWTFAYPLKEEKLKKENADLLDAQFKQLVDAFLVAKDALSK